MWGRELCQLELGALREEGDMRVFEYADPFGQPARGFVVMWKGELRAYRNLCPHWGVPMDHAGELFDETGTEIMCHVHGASFDPETGRCTHGPPEGSKLETFDVQEIKDIPGTYKITRRAGISLL